MRLAFHYRLLYGSETLGQIQLKSSTAQLQFRDELFGSKCSGLHSRQFDRKQENSSACSTFEGRVLWAKTFPSSPLEACLGSVTPTSSGWPIQVVHPDKIPTDLRIHHLWFTAYIKGRRGRVFAASETISVRCCSFWINKLSRKPVWVQKTMEDKSPINDG